MLQAGFVRRLLRRFDAEKVPVLIETCGAFRWPDMEKILPLVGAIYFDLKQIDPDAHRRYTGAGNRVILENFMRLAREFDGLTARMPVIPGINDDRDSIRAMARFLIGAGHRVLHCLPYHNLGEAKLARINSALSPLGLESLAADRLHAVKKMFKKEGIDAVIYD